MNYHPSLKLSDEQTYDSFDSRAHFEYKYSLIPRRCFVTKRFFWGLAVRGRVYRRDGDQIIYNDRWYHKDEAIIMMLKGPQ